MHVPMRRITQPDISGRTSVTASGTKNGPWFRHYSINPELRRGKICMDRYPKTKEEKKIRHEFTVLLEWSLSRS